MFIFFFAYCLCLNNEYSPVLCVFFFRISVLDRGLHPIRCKMKVKKFKLGIDLLWMFWGQKFGSSTKKPVFLCVRKWLNFTIFAVDIWIRNLKQYKHEFLRHKELKYGFVKKKINSKAFIFFFSITQLDEFNLFRIVHLFSILGKIFSAKYWQKMKFLWIQNKAVQYMYSQPGRMLSKLIVKLL